MTEPREEKDRRNRMLDTSLQTVQKWRAGDDLVATD